MGIFNFLSGKDKGDQMRLAKSETGDWMVKKGFSILYIGSRDKCETFMKQAQSASA